MFLQLSEKSFRLESLMSFHGHNQSISSGYTDCRRSSDFEFLDRIPDLFHTVLTFLNHLSRKQGLIQEIKFSAFPTQCLG